MYTAEDIMKVLNEKKCFTAIVKYISTKTEREMKLKCDFDCIYYDHNTKDVNGVKEMELCVALNDYDGMANITPIRDIIKILD